MIILEDHTERGIGYDDFLIETAFNETLPTDLRVLTGTNYGTVVDIMGLNPRFEGRSYRLFSQIATDHTEKDQG